MRAKNSILFLGNALGIFLSMPSKLGYLKADIFRGHMGNRFDCRGRCI